jgi:DNA-binding NarL/FixJ family response regulator
MKMAERSKAGARSSSQRSPAKKTVAKPAKAAPKASEKAIRTLIVEDHPLFRAGLRRVLELEEDIDVVGEAENGEVALTLARELLPDVILMDVNLPLVNGLQVTRDLTAERPELAVIVLTAYHDDEQMLHAVRAGAFGYFPKDVAPTELVHAIHQVREGTYVIKDEVLAKPQVATWLLTQFENMAVMSDEGPEETFRALSGREMEILKHITKGMSNKEIAKALGISRQTVKNHMTSILRKLAVNDRTQAAVYALRRGWIRLQDTK